MANDFSGDNNCVALWRMEEDALTVDSCTWNSARNTLTGKGTPENDTADFKEGACSADLDPAGGGQDSFYLPDADLCAEFPLKTGDTNKKISACGWFRFDSLSNYEGPFGKGDYGYGDNSVRPLYIESSGRWYSDIGYYDGSIQTEVLYQSDVSNLAQTGRWYHFGFTFDGIAKSWKLVVWDDTDSTKVINVQGECTNDIYVGGASVRVGAIGSFAEIDPLGEIDGNIDEIVVFNDILTLPQIDGIRAGIYPEVLGGSTFWPILFSLIEQQRKGE